MKWIETVIHGGSQSSSSSSCHRVTTLSPSLLSYWLNLALARLPFTLWASIAVPQHSGFTLFLSFPITSVYFLPLTCFSSSWTLRHSSYLSTSPCLRVSFYTPKSLSKPISYPFPPVLKSWIWIVGRWPGCSASYSAAGLERKEQTKH